MTSSCHLGELLFTVYSAKFSRCIIFAFFADWPQTAKIKLAKCFTLYVCTYTKHPWSVKFISRNVQHDQITKIVHLENLVLYSV